MTCASLLLNGCFMVLYIMGTSSTNSPPTPLDHLQQSCYTGIEDDCLQLAVMEQKKAMLRDIILSYTIRQPFNVSLTGRPPQQLIDRIVPPAAMPGDPDQLQNDGPRGSTTGNKASMQRRATIDVKYVFPSRVQSSSPGVISSTFFNLSNLDTNGQRVAYVSLNFRLKPPPAGAEDNAVVVGVHRFANATELILTSSIYRKQHKLSELAPKGGYLEVNVTALAYSWVEKPHQNHGIYLRCINDEAIDMIQRTAEDTFLRFHLKPTVPSRIESNDCGMQGSDQTKCCRKPLEVDFELFAWDWILAPKRYNAYFCAGKCPFGHMPRTPLAHFLQTIEASDDVDFGMCCTATHTESVEIFYFNQDREVIRKMIPGLKVVKCGCA